MVSSRSDMFVEFIPGIFTNTVDIGYLCYGTDFNMNRLAIRVMQPPTSSHIVYLDPKGKLIDHVNIHSRKHQQPLAFLISEYKFAIR
jgi:hypothetical protein